ncbi:hypothetical protein AXE80_10710 [Wenyingzhuangia fucanilytica]|uniref:BRCT domain-containing protein n=1 Tax=Wenyingzhuangia fucanilytica TaxID=1790137 RepID=A0A1B1Y7K5_9FLAO|nr:BRCT domain-containing protein [Wenyingzhuangia fucanilytica]ANW96714.1 hypothetical protein AXE80_10710 [Wenyingzhuangia fucanilytica]
MKLEIEKGFELEVWSKKEVAEILEVSINELDNQLEAAENSFKKNGIKRLYDINFRNEIDGFYITSIGLWFLTKSEQIKEVAFDDLLRFQEYKMSSPKKESTDAQMLYAISKKNNPEVFEDKKGGKELLNIQLDVENKEHLLYNKWVLITGEFNVSREEMRKQILSVGGINKGSISKSLHYVVVGENAGPSKMEKIDKIGIKTLTEKEFNALF